MSSNINPYNIDGTYPVAGQDNSSQGFRDNFTNIKNNFLFASSEISDLQAKALVTSALTGQTISNDMAGTQITRPQLKAWTQALLDLGTISTSTILDFNAANFQKVTTGSAISVSFSNWPTSTGSGALGYGVMRVWFVVTDVAHTITLPASVNIGVTDIAGYNSATGTITFDAAGNYIFDFSSIDGGSDYLVFDVTRNRSTLRDPGLYYNDQVNSTFLIGYGNGLTTALSLEQGQDKVSALGSFNSVAVGNIQLANVAYTQFDTGSISGYSVTGARGDLNTANVYPVLTNDLLGYVNSIAYTGTGTVGTNAFQQTSSIAFFATGNASAVSKTNGIGGNVAIFTGVDGRIGYNRINQAVGIENDQSTKIYGNLITAGGQVVTGYTYAAPSTNFTATCPVGVSRYIMDPTGTITNGNLQLPKVIQDGTIIEVSSTQTITNLSVWGGSGVTIVPSANVTLTAGTSVAYFWHNSETKWYKIR